MFTSNVNTFFLVHIDKSCSPETNRFIDYWKEDQDLCKQNMHYNRDKFVCLNIFPKALFLQVSVVEGGGGGGGSLCMETVDP
jgi:hypothetical protein